MRTHRHFSGLLLLSLTVWLPGCGSDGPTQTVTPTTTVPPAPVRTVIAQGGAALGPFFFGRTSFVSSATGTIDATVDWTHASNTVFVYIAEGTCTVEQFASDDCPGPACACRFSARSETATPKPRVLTLPNAAAGTRTLIVWNLGPSDESIAFQVTLTTTGGAAARASTRPPAVERVAKGVPARRQP